MANEAGDITTRREQRWASRGAQVVAYGDESCDGRCGVVNIKEEKQYQASRERRVTRIVLMCAHLACILVLYPTGLVLNHVYLP